MAALSQYRTCGAAPRRRAVMGPEPGADPEPRDGQTRSPSGKMLQVRRYGDRGGIMTDAENATGPGEDPVPAEPHDRKRTALVIVLVIAGLLITVALAYGSVKLFNQSAFDVEVFDEKGQGQLVP